jgi:hypothetical protein
MENKPMKQHTKWLGIASVVAGGLSAVSSAQAQAVTGTPYMSNISPSSASFFNYWADPFTTITSTPTGLQINSEGGAGSFSTMYYAIPSNQQTALNPLDSQVTFDFYWNSGDAIGGVNVLFALDDSMGGVEYYGTGYNIPTPGLNSYTFALAGANAPDVADGAIINGLNFQIDPGNVDGTYSITYSSLVLSVPEPATLALVGLGVAGFLAFRRRQ